MNSYCIIVFIERKTRPQDTFYPASWEGDLHVARTGKQWVPQHTYTMPGLSCSHSVLGSQQWAGYLGTWRFPPKRAWVPKYQGNMESRGRGQGGGNSRSQKRLHRMCTKLGGLPGAGFLRCLWCTWVVPWDWKIFIPHPLRTQTFSIMQFAKAPLLMG